MLRLDDMDKEGGKANEIAVSHPLIERFVTLVGWLCDDILFDVEFVNGLAEELTLLVSADTENIDAAPPV